MKTIEIFDDDEKPFVDPNWEAAQEYLRYYKIGMAEEAKEKEERQLEGIRLPEDDD